VTLNRGRIESQGPAISVPAVTILRLFEHAVERFGDQTAFSFMGKELSYRELGDLVDRLAAGLQRLGLSKGDRVGLLLPTCPQYAVALLACMKIGVIAINNMSPLFTDGEVARQLADAQPRALVVLDELLQRAEQPARQNGVESVIVTSLTDWFADEAPACEAGAGHLRLTDLVQPGDDATFTPLEIDDVAVFQYTGGTSGEFKGAMLTHRNLGSIVHACRLWGGWREGNERCLLALPIAHIYCLTVGFLGHIVNASNILTVPEFRVDQIAALLSEFQPTWFLGVPRFYSEMIEYRTQGHPIDFSSVHYCISGAAPLPPLIWERFKAMFGCEIREGYGCSECSPVIACNPMIDGRLAKKGSVGPVFFNTTVRLEPIEDATDPTIGEVLVKGPQVMRGFWRSEERTREALAGGWLHTGDLGRFDADGYLSIVGRKKDMICVGGYNAYPDEIEAVLRQHPKLADAAVAGTPHYSMGEVVAAFCVLRPNQKATPGEIIAFCRARLAKYKVPGIVEFVESIPRDVLNKVKRQELCDLHLTRRQLLTAGPSRDPLTGCYTPSYLKELEDRLARIGEPWGAIVVRIEEGAALGEETGVGRFLTSLLRNNDVVVRLDTGEFLMVVIAAPAAVQAVVGRTRKLLREQVPHRLSAGSALPLSGEPLAEVIARAKANLC
jgi:long-chain acyl-CoA synthetase